MGRDIAQIIVRKVTTIDENRSVLEAAIVMTEGFRFCRKKLDVLA